MAILPHGSNRSVGTTATALTAASYPNSSAIEIKSAAGNGGKVYVGYDSTVTASSAAGTDGFELSAGESCTISRAIAETTNDVWLIGSTGTQVVFWRATGSVQQAEIGWALDYSVYHTSGYLAIP